MLQTTARLAYVPPPRCTAQMSTLSVSQIDEKHPRGLEAARPRLVISQFRRRGVFGGGVLFTNSGSFAESAGCFYGHCAPVSFHLFAPLDCDELKTPKIAWIEISFFFLLLFVLRYHPSLPRDVFRCPSLDTTRTEPASIPKDIR
ncbi:hypothetical protein GGTG_12745 [Gaeumannomyces tritici R3-111a-1]|uniref:Uncharacterized protein n=1 Tax=Gaeumannomyces tritici (strain R3-111a-1) TaxID=644352 RepID=J3PGW5_GAET3|nr:hypothetical protein GGTG_12745 [Gaeumannomyces tritici R3-111a-1]EJT69862.1 hypothetical protein GGTG_12745 [Gaeumannomyces tritici R3-111a-1]